MASELAQELLNLVKEFGDQQVAVIVQTGPDSYRIEPVNVVGFSTLDDKNSCMVIEP